MVMNMMANGELINWCKEHNYCFYRSLAALLSTFTPDENELNSWDIREEDTIGEFSINGASYIILSEKEAYNQIEIFKEDVEDDYKEEVPERLQEYIDWKSFWKDNPITIKEFYPDWMEINFAGETYYYTENGIIN